MKSEINIKILAVLVLLGITTGFVVHVVQHPEPETSATSISPISSFSSRSSSRPLAVTGLATALKKHDRKKHWLQWIGSMERADLDELPFFVALAGDNETLLRLIANRWLTLDTQNFFETLINLKRNPDRAVDFSSFQFKTLTNFLFEEWISRDSDAAIAVLSAPETFSVLAASAPGIRHKVLSMLFKQDPRRAIELTATWNTRHLGASTDSLKKWIRQNPQEAAMALLEFAPRYESENHLKILSEIWAKADPVAALDFALARRSAHGDRLAQAALAAWARRDFAAAAEWLTELADPLSRSRFGATLVDVQARKQPAAAVAWAQEQLSGQHLAVALRQVAGRVADSNPQAALKLLEQIDSYSAYRQAASAVAISWFKRMDRQGEIDPKAVAWLRRLDEEKPLNEAITKIGHHWAKTDSGSYREFLKSPRQHTLSHSSYTAGIYDLMRADPHGTLAWAQELPERWVTEVSKSAFSTWYYSQPGAALDWYIQLPKEDLRRPKVVEGLVQYTTFLPVHISAERLGKLPAGHKAELHRALQKRGDLETQKKAALLEILSE